MKHYGGVIIGKNADIGALNTTGGVIEPTILDNNVVTDDHVHIAHNCRIEKLGNNYSFIERRCRNR